MCIKVKVFISYGFDTSVKLRKHIADISKEMIDTILKQLEGDGEITKVGEYRNSSVYALTPQAPETALN
ncbi:hypothetical protein B0T45_09235 [Chromobacterium haemolyticum]|uniref:Uncharacterized protein n=1 Tax=Chromobacterium haemolyticum TaxID=394935 RepID=A0A1W0D1W4_9NEIS|nr:hypothetical protein B0T45_09235 [Chromobacterium haemolyticum]